MGILNDFEGDAPGGKAFTYGRAKLLVRPVPSDVDRELRRRTLGDVRSRRAGKELLARALDRQDQYTAARAAYALLDTQNFAVGLMNQAAADVYSALLKRELKAGGEALLDGSWTDDVKARIFAKYPRFASKVSDLADSITQDDLEEEGEATEAF